MKKQHGYSLIELMLSISLGLILTLALIELFINNKVNYRIQEGLARVQENGRYAKYYLNKEIRMAGFQGCSNLSFIQANVVVKNPSADVTFNINDAILGYESSGGGWAPALPAHLTGLIAAGTDVVVIRKASSLGVTLKNNMAQPTSAVTVEDRLGIQPGEILFITDCSSADIFMAGANTTATAIAHGSNDNTSPNFSIAYLTDAQLMRFESFSFYVGDTGRINSNGQAILALFQLDTAGISTELVEGVQNLQATYGVDTTGDNSADTYMDANAVTTAGTWPQVKSVRLSLLFNTIEEVNPQVQNYVFQGQTVTPANQMLYRQWDTFITLRNR